MTTHKLDKKQWRTFFDRVSTTLEGKRPKSRSLRSALAIRSKRSGCLCSAFAYDPTMTSSRGGAEGLDHLDPQSRSDIYVEDAPGGIGGARNRRRGRRQAKSSSFAIVDAAGPIPESNASGEPLPLRSSIREPSDVARISSSFAASWP